MCDFIHVLIFVTVSKCRKSPKLTNIVILWWSLMSWSAEKKRQKKRMTHAWGNNSYFNSRTPSTTKRTKTSWIFFVLDCWEVPARSTVLTHTTVLWTEFQPRPLVPNPLILDICYVACDSKIKLCNSVQNFGYYRSEIKSRSSSLFLKSMLAALGILY